MLFSLHQIFNVICFIIGYQIRLTDCLYIYHLDYIIVWCFTTVIGILSTNNSLFYFMLMVIIGWFICDFAETTSMGIDMKIPRKYM